MPGPLPPLRLGPLICHKAVHRIRASFRDDPEQVSAGHAVRERAPRRIAPSWARTSTRDLGSAGWQGTGTDRVDLGRPARVCMGDAVPAPPTTPRAQHSIAGRVQPGCKLALVLVLRGVRRAAGQLLPERAAVCPRRPARHHSLQEGTAVGLPSGTSPAQPSRFRSGKHSCTLYEPGRGDERRDSLAQAIALNTTSSPPLASGSGTARTTPSPDDAARTTSRIPRARPQLYYQRPHSPRPLPTPAS